MPRPFRRVVTIAPGATWPDQEQTAAVPPFWWLHIQNRGVPGSGNDVWVSILDRLRPSMGDKPDTIVKAGAAVTENIGADDDPPATSLHLTNVGTAAVDVMVQTGDTPIVYQTAAL